MHCLHMRVIFQVLGESSVKYVYELCMFVSRKERASDDLWVANALSCATSVVKADRVQGGAATSCVYER